MDYEKIKQLMEDVGNSKISSIDIDFPDGTKIKMTKEVKSTDMSQEENKKEIAKNITKAEVQKIEGNIVKSPMVGTFYLKPAPTSSPFVEVGKTVKKGETLCIIEAMKLMNEIESDYDGKIVKILVKDGEPVEYGKPLFIIE